MATQAPETTHAAFRAATRPISLWCIRNTQLPNASTATNAALLNEMDAVRYASSLRASVNRRGNWHNFDYWHALGFGTRTEIVTRTSTQVAELRALVDSALHDQEFALAHDFLRFLQATIEKEMAALYEWAEGLGEAAFKAPLGSDLNYWAQCQNRWGGGPGYKIDITTWTRQ